MTEALTKALTEEQIDECRQVFSRYENEDNYISLEVGFKLRRGWSPSSRN